MNRRVFVFALSGLAASSAILSRVSASKGDQTMGDRLTVVRSDDEWRRLLSEEQYRVLRREGTEPPWTSPLNEEKRSGNYVCAGCGQPLFTSDMKFDSGTGWPSFFEVIDGAIRTKRDFKLLLPRTEYHCARCGGHQGHVFKDGPEPTGLRYCNNGVALKFVPD
jgi:peptide-methionine (R)-S-oxide reductase